MRWGLVGFGWVARDHHLPGLLAAGHEVAGVVDPSPAARAEAEARGLPILPDIAALERAGADAIYVATPNHLHRPAVEQAAELGLPVLCEKPMAATLADAEAMAAAITRSGTLYGTAFDQRHHPAHVAVRDLVAAGEIGHLAAIRIVYACWVGVDFAADNWRVRQCDAGGGAVIDLAPHGLDLAQFLGGEPLLDLTMLLQRRIHAYGVDDGGMLIGRTAGGTLVQLHVAYNCPEGLPRRRLELVGSEGSLVSTNSMGQDAGGAVVRLCGHTGCETPVAFDGGVTPFQAQAAAFARAARGEAHDFSLTRDLALTRLFHRAHDAALTDLAA